MASPNHGDADEDDELLLSVSGSRRTAACRSSVRTISSTKQRKQNALELLKQVRSDGKVHRQRVADIDADVYEEITEDEYQARREQQREFVERDGSNYYGEEEEEEEEEEDGYAYDSPHRGKRAAKAKKDKCAKRPKPSEGCASIKSMFAAAAAAGAALRKEAPSEESISLENDDFLKECLAGITGAERGNNLQHSQPIPANLAQSRPRAEGAISKSGSASSSHTITGNRRQSSSGRGRDLIPQVQLDNLYESETLDEGSEGFWEPGFTLELPSTKAPPLLASRINSTIHPKHGEGGERGKALSETRPSSRPPAASSLKQSNSADACEADDEKGNRKDATKARDRDVDMEVSSPSQNVAPRTSVTSGSSSTPKLPSPKGRPAPISSSQKDSLTSSLRETSKENTPAACNIDSRALPEESCTKQQADEVVLVGEEMAPWDNAVRRLYWIDAFEDPFKHPGIVYLFGRVPPSNASSGSFHSCCLVVRNIRRRLYFLKRELNRRDASEVTLRDVQSEVEHRLRKEFGITKVRCAPADPQLRYLVRGERQPSRFFTGASGTRDGDEQQAPESEPQLLEVQIEAVAGKCPPPDWEGNTFERVLNTTTTALEQLLTQFGIKGPCWLELLGAAEALQHVSYCQEEYAMDMEHAGAIRALTAHNRPPPPICLAAMNILTAVSEKDKERQVVMASILYSESSPLEKSQLDARKLKRFCLLTKLENSGVSLPFNLEDQLKQRRLGEVVKRMPDERSLLSCLLAKLTQINPDLLVAHDLTAHLQLLKDRLLKYNLPNWAQLGRLKRSVPLKTLASSMMRGAQWVLTAGRLCLDLKVAAAELVHARSYELDELVEQILRPVDAEVKRIELSAEQMAEPFSSSAPQINLLDLMEWSWNEVFFALRILHQLNVVPLFLQITQIVGGVLSRTMMGGRADRNDYLLLHACCKNKYIAPDKNIRGFHRSKTTGSAAAAKKKAGGKRKQGGGGENEEDEENNCEDAGEAMMDEGGEGREAPDQEDEGATGPKQPEAKRGKGAKKAGGPQYSGGLVLDPKQGFYQNCIILLDFNSLYPSIIQEYNICFTTVPSAFIDVEESDLPAMPESSRPDGILKREIRELVNRRREVKALMQKVKPDSELYVQYNIRQMGLKLTANSMYGCLGFEGSRFYARTLAAMVTAKGREILMHAKHLVETEGHAVIYGDTDSLMIDTNEDDVAKAKAIGQKLKQAVNKNYRQLELDIDGIYRRLLLLRKKKYAALAVVDLNGKGEVLKKEMKGLDIVRRDWSEIAKDIGEEVLELILRSEDRERLAETVVGRLTEFRTALNEGTIAAEKFEILKQLHRDPEADVRNSKTQPHIQVALRLNETKRFHFRSGDIVRYVICRDGTTNSHTQRGYHLSELAADSERLSLDTDYYLANQVLPVVSRLCEPIDELGQSRVAESLGLDTKRYGGGGGRRVANGGVGGHAIDMLLGEEEYRQKGAILGLEHDFSKCEGLQLECTKCKHVTIIRSPLEGQGPSLACVLEMCPGCSTSFHPQMGSILRQLVLKLKEWVRRNIDSPYKCEDVACEAMVLVPHPDQFTNDGLLCHMCGSVMHKVYSDRSLFDQLCFFKHIFDLEAAKKEKDGEEIEKLLRRRSKAQETAENMGQCLAVVERFLKANAFNRVDLARVFAPLFFNRRAKTSSSEALTNQNGNAHTGA